MFWLLANRTTHYNSSNHICMKHQALHNPKLSFVQPDMIPFHHPESHKQSIQLYSLIAVLEFPHIHVVDEA